MHDLLRNAIVLLVLAVGVAFAPGSVPGLTVPGSPAAHRAMTRMGGMGGMGMGGMDMGMPAGGAAGGGRSQMPKSMSGR